VGIYAELIIILQLAMVFRPVRVENVEGHAPVHCRNPGDCLMNQIRALFSCRVRLGQAEKRRSHTAVS